MISLVFGAIFVIICGLSLNYLEKRRKTKENTIESVIKSIHKKI